MPNKYRTHTCGQLSASEAGETVTLSGWVHSRRDHGGLIFVDLRDHYGLTQLTFDPKEKQVFTAAEQLRDEWVIHITGKVAKRPAEMVNEKLPTGEIEIEVSDLNILNKSETPPFEIPGNMPVNEELRLTHRYLDMRREKLQRNLVLRHRMLQSVRNFFYDREFLEIETPLLIKNTPEGAREYIVPSRVHPGHFYVLPQSPQQLKQLLMVGGVDKYMQIARVFRDEDQRGDRQPEFTQVDIEMAFVEPEDVMRLTEECLIELTKTYRQDVTIKQQPFPQLSWHEALSTYGSDKPDLRFDLAFTDVTELCRDCGFTIFANVAANGGAVQALSVPSGAALSRSNIDDLTEIAKIHGGKGLAWIKVTENGFEGVPSAKLGEEKTKEIAASVGAKPGDLILFSADTFEAACLALGGVRSHLGAKLNLIAENEFAFCWVTKFPLLEMDEATGEVSARHHPFTRPYEKDINKLAEDPMSVRAQAYDIALNGNEIAGGSIRIHEPELQKQILTAMNMKDKDAKQRFGHMLTAFQYGAPPHGGIAWGFDRLVMLFANEPNIREVIAFPKDQKAKDLMLGAPSEVDPKLLKDLHLTVHLDSD